MADRNKRQQRPARAGGLSKGERARSGRGQGRAAIASTRAPSRLTAGRLVTTALVVAAALGTGVLVRERLAAPPTTGPDQPSLVVEPAELAEAPPEATQEVGVPVVAEPAPASPTPTREEVAEAPQLATPPAASEPSAEDAQVAESALPTGAPPDVVTAEAEAQAVVTPEPISQPEATVAPRPRRPEPRTYTVQPRDTLKGIAARYGVSIASIRASNHIPNPESLTVGQVLVIPSS